MEQLRMYLPQGGANDTLHAIVSANLSECRVHVAFAAFGKGDVVTRFEKLELSPDLASDFRKVVSSIFGELNDDLCTHTLRIHDYAAGAKLHPHEVEYVLVSALESVRSQLVLLSNLAGLELFDAHVEFVSDLRFYVIILQPPIGLPIYCFRTYSAKNQLNRSWFAAIRYGDAYYSSVEEPGFLFDHNIDSICRGNDMFIINKDKFQRTFQFYEYIHRDAEKALKRVKSRVPIANEADFVQACSQEIRMAAIVASLLDAPHIEVLSITRIRRAIDRFQLGVEIVEQNGEDMLVYKPSTKWEFLGLLCDNYVTSEVTDLAYEAPFKRPIRTTSK
ncbi:MAG TPA: Kiwa anti-phage protein KwaB-like domain-containing protein [Ktedonobacterales bacterium]|nr:Kiwa anti-phage protein KwaB-like domain-containing protein [Ktedonobacterales bacterium]